MAATNEQSSILVPLRGEDLAEGPNDNLQPHEISTLLIQQGNIDEQQCMKSARCSFRRATSTPS